MYFYPTKRSFFQYLYTFFFAAFSSLALAAQTDLRQDAARILNNEMQIARISASRIRVDSMAQEKRVLKFFASESSGYVPYRQDNVARIYDSLRHVLPEEYQRYKIQVWANGRLIEERIPIALRERRPKEKTWAPQVSQPLVRPENRPYALPSGLEGRHIALWQSHGLYFEQKLDRWEWQRARIFQTVEDLYTQSYVLPFLVPMLENAGAYVLLPRERDVHKEEIIVDNNEGIFRQGSYSEQNGTETWQEGQHAGFAHKRIYYANEENPFRDGTYRQTKTSTKGDEASATWTPNIPSRGEYAVYVSYQSLPGSTDDALYTVRHLGGESRFHVNQQMGGGTWIYLGSFLFAEGENPDGCIVLSNRSTRAGRIVTADAVKIGGGMGNIARGEDRQKSGFPRFTEGARYWLQWAGAPDSVYNWTKGESDYTDDYTCRGFWVNWLAGGSQVLPKRDGLHVPIDLSMAFHSDAGTTLDDQIIGTLLIYMTETEGRSTYSNGASRWLAADLADLVQSQIVDDVRRLHAPEWNRRGCWNKSYHEARVPEVPAILLELLSHQNFADMRYGLDPRFRFTVSRAVYKALLRFLAAQRGTPYVVQPLPVDRFWMEPIGSRALKLHWHAVEDSLEATASPTRYLVQTRIGDGGWDQGTLCRDTTFSAQIEEGSMYSWRILALNDGGCSFPSEILSAGIPLGGSLGKAVLVVNGFERISAPADFEAPGEASRELAGFLDEYDHGVPYLQDINYIGSMKEFRRGQKWMDDDNSGFGESYNDYADRVVAGNTFDYPSVHGSSLLSAGRSFLSSSVQAVEQGSVQLHLYDMVDLILGKQCQTKMGNGKTHPLRYKTFGKELQHILQDYLQKHGGRLFASGAYIGTDLWDNPLCAPDKEDLDFASQVLHYRWRAHQAARRNGLRTVLSPYSRSGSRFDWYHALNDTCYVVEAPDAIEPEGEGAHTVLRYEENNTSAGVAFRNDEYATFLLGVPFEAIHTPEQRDLLMQMVLDHLFM